MRRFLTRFAVGVLAAWLASFLLPGITTDESLASLVLVGLLLAVGEVLLPLADGLVGVLFFFLPKGVRIFALRFLAVLAAAALTDGFGFTDPLVGPLGLTILLTILFLLPLTA